MVQKFKEHVKNKNLFSINDKLLLAVSGGVDSVVLCELCKQAGIEFEIAHCNFQLRGEESERDEKFVIEMGKKYEVKVLVKKFDTEVYAKENKISIQEAARGLRYEWFEELLTPDPIAIGSNFPTPNHLLTAHHADDNAETIAMNFFRGTGLHGLTGIPIKNGNVIRPLLIFSKEEILEFNNKNELEFVEDSSNQSSKYTRNLFRNEIIPAIAKVFPQVKENLLDNINRFGEIEKLYKLSVAELKKKLVKEKGAEWHIPIKQLMGFDNRALIYEIIAEFGFNEKQIAEVIKLAASESGRYIDSPVFQYRIIKHRHWFIISPIQSTVAATIVIDQQMPSVLFEKGFLKIEKATNQKQNKDNSVAIIDASQIKFPLLLRKWKQGDYFYPLGMKKKKKLSRFFIDQKFSKSEKENMWVIEMNKKIIWVVGHRIDDRFKITDKTTSNIIFSLETGNV